MNEMVQTYRKQLADGRELLDELLEDDERLKYSDCGLGTSKCEDAKDVACLIERGDNFFYEKALNCQEGKGILAMIYNNVEGEYDGTLTSEEAFNIEIPVISLTRSEGRLLRDEPDGELVFSQWNGQYTYRTGTSMATPHVSGVAAKIWAARPECTSDQVQEALIETARKLDGQKGGDRDDRYGYGLVQAFDAYEYLLAMDRPCGLGPPSASPSDPPTPSPTDSPTFSPTSSPTSCDHESAVSLSSSVFSAKVGGMRRVVAFV